MKHVSFSNNIETRYFNKDNSPIKSCLPYILKKHNIINDSACTKIMHTINQWSPHKIIIRDDEIPFYISSNKLMWCEDNTPQYYLTLFTNNRTLFRHFINEFNNTVKRYVQPNTSSNLEYNSSIFDIKIKINAITRYN